ncbi:group II intron reverse transcriptase/maturase [Kitasatospora cystarginea]|uniref:group II intron reverse transcriptase/maturase n=1 Tax=Kitasatospora cystarginea TaxID=58350 RepID=UPI0031D4EAA5
MTAVDWHSIDWAETEGNVRRLRQRIFKAAQTGDMKKLRNLQKLMLRSHSNTLVSVKRATQVSAGRKTAGLDGETVLTPKRRGEVAAEIHRSAEPWKARPVKRVYIPKSNDKQRPLGIPVIRDRIMQARVKNAMEPEWEARFDPRSYGFRPGRSCQDAERSIYNVVSGKSAHRAWVLDADLSAAFDKIHHERLMEQIGLFPGREPIWRWLRAGVVDRGRFAPMEEGTPQGGVISPLLLNVALNGMEAAAGVRCRKRVRPQTDYDSPVLIRYADDFVVLTHTEAEALAAKDKLAKWLEPRGLRFNEEKTKVVHLTEGFDFLGFNIRRSSSGKAIVRPSKAAVKRIRKRLRDEVKNLYGVNAEALLRKLNPIIRGWATYYRGVASKEVFTSLDTYVWRLIHGWAVRQHRSKPRMWVLRRYFGNFNKSRKDRWVFGVRATGAYLLKFRWTPIVRHFMVRGGASPDDPSLREYWASRTRSVVPHLDKMSLSLAARQKGLCPLCKQALIAGAEYEPDHPREWMAWFAASKKMLNKHHFVYRRDGGSDDSRNIRLIHAECHRQLHANDGGTGPVQGLQGQ